MEDDILNLINHLKTGADLATQPCVEWVMKQLHRMSDSYKEKLPTKSRKFRYPQFLWVSAVYHDGFGNGNFYREKFNRSLMDVSSHFREMHILHLAAWNSQSADSVANGLHRYWEAVNNAFKSWDKMLMKFNTQPKPKFGHESRRQQFRNDRYHWSSSRSYHKRY